MVFQIHSLQYLFCFWASRHPSNTNQTLLLFISRLQLVTGDQLVVIERGILIRRAELSHGGVYHCQVEEHGYHWTAVTVRLSVWSPSANHLLASLTRSSYQSGGTQPWYEDVMALIHPSNLGLHCKALGYRPPRNRHLRGDIMAEPIKEKERGKKQKHGGGKGGGGGGGRAVGRKSRSKPQQRAPRSAWKCRRAGGRIVPPLCYHTLIHTDTHLNTEIHTDCMYRDYGIRMHLTTTQPASTTATVRNVKLNLKYVQQDVSPGPWTNKHSSRVSLGCQACWMKDERPGHTLSAVRTLRGFKLLRRN